MTTARASEVLRALARHEKATKMQSLAHLDAAARAEVKRALLVLKPTARVDVAVLVSTIRSRVDRPSRDEVVASIEGRLRAIAERLIESGETDDGSEASRVAMAMFGPGPTKPKSIPRVRSRRAGETPDSPPDRADPAPTAVERASGRPRAVARASMPGFFAGPRLLGPGIDCDPRAHAFSPPWLLDPGDDEEPDEEILDDGIVDEARADAR